MFYPSPVLKLFDSPPKSSNFLLPPLTGSKKDVELMHKPLIQNNCQQIKKQKQIRNLKKYNKPNINLNI